MTRKIPAHRKFIALVLTTALTIAGLSPAPARADDKTAGILFGLAALTILGLAVKDHNDREKARSHDFVTRNAPKPDIPLHPEWKPRPLPPELQRYVLPRQCLRNFRDRGDSKLVVGERCLRQNYAHMRQLPRNCRVDTWTNRGHRQGYSLECLENRGYRLSRN